MQQRPEQRKRGDRDGGRGRVDRRGRRDAEDEQQVASKGDERGD
ncbi:MAG: hypothetical protein U0556_07745 [Dehalococcoidia bacterium]